MTEYVIYTDGSYRRSVNRGGIGIVWLKNGKKVYEYSKGFGKTTNNVMELLAIKIALLSIKNPIQSLLIYSDSEYAIGCITNKNWNPKKNIELIESIKKLLIEKQKLISTPIEIRHVFGHSISQWNNYADKLATNASLFKYN